jgi:hypothetical protein
MIIFYILFYLVFQGLVDEAPFCHPNLLAKQNFLTYMYKFLIISATEYCRTFLSNIQCCTFIDLSKDAYPSLLELLCYDAIMVTTTESWQIPYPNNEEITTYYQCFDSEKLGNLLSDYCANGGSLVYFQPTGQYLIGRFSKYDPFTSYGAVGGLGKGGLGGRDTPKLEILADHPISSGIKSIVWKTLPKDYVVGLKLSDPSTTKVIAVYKTVTMMVEKTNDSSVIIACNFAPDEQILQEEDGAKLIYNCLVHASKFKIMWNTVLWENNAKLTDVDFSV